MTSRGETSICARTTATGTLPIGQRVRHAVFGEGTVLDVDLNKGAHVIQFDGMGTPRSISLRAKLEKIGP